MVISMNTLVLPDNYRPIAQIDLQKNTKLAVAVNLGALAFAAVLGFVGHLFVPLSAVLSIGEEADLSALLFVLLKLLVMLVCCVLYMILHEAVHGVFMKYYGGIKPKFGLTALYAYCGSDAYFDKTSYLVIGLSPVVIWGAVLAAVCVVIPAGWFWVAYFIQIINLSGAVGDFYVTYRMLKMPKEILVQDSGVSMTVYAPDTDGQ